MSRFEKEYFDSFLCFSLLLSIIMREKYHLTKDQNRRFARMNLTRLVHTNARFEGINTTLAQTQTIIDGLGVEGVKLEDINTIVQVKRGWQLITESDEVLILDFEKSINKIVARDDALDIGLDNNFIPDMVDISNETDYLSQLLKSNISNTEKALRIMYHNMRKQLFWDGNKRTATLVANKLMIDNGAGIINVPLDRWGVWNELISSYYQSNHMDKLLEWTYDNAIQGVQL